MSRLYLFAEGRTEQTFASTVLSPHLASHGVYVQGPILVANSRRGRAIHRGGIRTFSAMQHDIVRFLKQESADDVFFTSMIDLYALPGDFPCFEEANRYRADPYRRVEALEASWADETADRRFIPFIQLHEYEAYLFADVSQLSHFYPDKNAEIEALRRIVDIAGSPELIDDEPHTAPSKQIIGQFPDYKYVKATVGSQAAERIGLATIRCRCRHFARWLGRLEQLGQGNTFSQCRC